MADDLVQDFGRRLAVAGGGAEEGGRVVRWQRGQGQQFHRVQVQGGGAGGDQDHAARRSAAADEPALRSVLRVGGWALGGEAFLGGAVLVVFLGGAGLVVFFGAVFLVPFGLPAEAAGFRAGFTGFRVSFPTAFLGGAWSMVAVLRGSASAAPALNTPSAAVSTQPDSE